MVAAAKPYSAAECRARPASRGYILCSPPGWPSRISGAGADADPGVHRMPGISPRVNSRSRTPSSRRCSEVNCMVVPFGSAAERRSRTTYRPTVTPEGSTHVDTAFTGTTSSFSRTASGRLAVVAVVRQRVFAEALRGEVFGVSSPPVTAEETSSRSSSSGTCIYNVRSGLDHLAAALNPSAVLRQIGSCVSS